MENSSTAIAKININKRNTTIKRRLINAGFYAFFGLLAAIFMFPYFLMLMKSLMTSEEVVNPQLQLFPAVPQFRNYILLFAESTYGGGGYASGLFYTLVVVGSNMLIVPISASIIAFSFAKLQWKGRNFMFALMLSTIMLPAVVTQLPLYVMYTGFGWINTLYPLIIPNLFGGGAINIFLLRQFMLGIPKDMDEAAKIDGAGAFRRYAFITIPLCVPILLYVMVTVLMANWGDFYGPLIYLPSMRAPRTLAYAIFYDSMNANASTAKANLRMAGGVFMTVIPVVVFALFQKALIEGVAVTGLKG